MRTKTRLFLLCVALASLITVLLFGLIGCGSDASQVSVPVPTQSPPVVADFAGSSTCRTCHPNEYTLAQNHGHASASKKVVNGLPSPSYPQFFRTIRNGSTVNCGFLKLPSPVAWSDISYIVGGFGWRGLYINKQGYFVSYVSNTATGAQTRVGYLLTEPNGQLFTDPNMPPDSAVINNSNVTSGCMLSCHVTGAQLDDPAGGNPAPHQDNLAGLGGNFSEPGVTCEQCHGPGNIHAITQKKEDINKTWNTPRGTYGPKACHECHEAYDPNSDRAQVTKYKVEGDPNVFFMGGHERMLGLNNSPHKGVDCTACHDPHKDTVYGEGGTQGFSASAVTNGCLSCHPGKAGAGTNHSSDATCIDCHMPYLEIQFSGVPYNKNTGDMRVHLFKINPNPVSRNNTADPQSMFYVQPFVPANRVNLRLDANGQTTGINLDIACFSCHNPNSATPIPLATLSQRALGTGPYVGKPIHPTF